MVSKKIGLGLLLGASVLSLGGCWVAAAGVGGEAGYLASQEDRTAGQTIDDQAISTSIKTKLLADSSTPGLKIDVDTFKNAVTLRGYVRTQAEADAALRIARRTSGVTTVDSRIIVDSKV